MTTWASRFRRILSVLFIVLVGNFSIPARGSMAMQCGNPDLPPTCGIHEYCSPIIIDVGGTGFKLTNANSGVWFDIRGVGRPLKISWTAPQSLNAFLVLDRNHDGLINSGLELFGNLTSQPKSAEPNGFLALAEFDKVENGGNGDGIIDSHDKVFSSLRLWIDANHDGISQPEELFNLPDLGVFSISLNYHEARRLDEFGNQFRFKTKINVKDRNDTGPDVGPIAYDIFFNSVQSVP
jgi:hypothetical protein